MRTLERVLAWTLSHPRLTVLLVYLAAIWLHPSTAAALPFIVGFITLDPVNTATTKNIMPGLADDFFKADPLLEFFKNRHHVYPGGPIIQENLIYKPMIGAAYAKGVGGFNISKRQTFTGLQFGPRYYEVSIPEYLEEVEIEVNGPTAVLSMVKTDMGNGALTMSAILAIDLYHDGQNIGGVDHTLHMNGLSEALSDGTNASWDGRTYSSYGQQTRADLGPAIKTPAGFIPANVNGTITYRVLEHSYQSVVIGKEHPVLGQTSNRAMGFIGENFQPAQRVDAVEPTIGYTGIKFKQATIVESQYIPSQDGINDPDIGDYSAASEQFLWLNPGPEGEDAYIKLRVSPSPRFQFGFTGFKPAQDNTVVVGQVLYAGNVTCRAVRLQRWLFGITS
ncbi:MAG TPA: hypothetical protein VFO16_24190 [Pseudonocardiaceae bacterium]|nr:hypothetical protein [Pseudonocardiaceae bacterium]